MKLKREKNKIKKKHFWLKAIIGFLPFCFTCSIANNINVSNTLNVQKTNISDVFDTLPTWENLRQEPTSDQVLTYLNKYLVNSNKSQYSSVINEIMITKIENGLVNMVTKPDSREYTGSYEFHYSFYNKIDLSTLLNKTYIGSLQSNSPTTSQILLRIHEKFPSIDTNQLTLNTNDIIFDSDRYYHVNIVADPESNLYYGTGNILFSLIPNKKFQALGLDIYYSDAIVTTEPTLNDNKILLNSSGWYCIDKVDDSSTYWDKNITTADNTDVKIYINQGSTWKTTGTNSLTVGENSTLNFSTSANTVIIPVRNDEVVPAGIRVPYSSSFILTGKTGAEFRVWGADGRCPGAGIGGDGCKYNAYGPEDRTTSYLSCGDVQLLGGLSMVIHGGDIDCINCGGGSAGIGGGGCCTGYAGNCKSVTIDVTGICNIYGGSKSSSVNPTYSSPGCAIGGGSCGSYSEVIGPAGVYNAGSLEKITINSGYINCVSQSEGTSIGGASTIGGGGASGTWNWTKNQPLYFTGGDLGSFEMNGGLLIVGSELKSFMDGPIGTASAIGGGGVVSNGRNMSSTAISKSTCRIGNMNSFVLNGGNIYISKGSHRSDQKNAGSSTYGRAGHIFNINGIPITYGTQSIFQINNGSLFQDEVFEDGTNTFSMHPSNINNQTLYPCLVPSTINGVSTIGKTLTIPSINYSCNLENLAEYNSSCEPSGCLWLPVGNYTDIMIDGIAYSANITAITNPTTTENIVL